MPDGRRQPSGWEDPVGAFVRWAVESLRTSAGTISWTKAIVALLLIGFVMLMLLGTVAAFLLGRG